MRTIIFIAALGFSLLAQPPTDQKIPAPVEQLLARPHVELEVILETGSKLAEEEQFEAARMVFARGVTEYPQNFESRYNLALADFALHRFAEAQRTLEGARTLSKDQQVAGEYLRGKIYDALGQTEAAEKSLLSAVREAPEQEIYALDLGLHYLRLHSYAKALATLRAAEQRHPESTYLELELAVAQVLGDDPSRAADTCKKILGKEPNFGPARVLMIVSYYFSGEYQICATEAAQAMRQPGISPFVYYLHAASLLKVDSKEYGVMLHDLDEANRHIPECAFCYFARSKVQQEMGNDTAAIADLETLVTRIDPEFSQGWYRLGNLYRRVGRTEDAARALEKCRTIKSEQSAHELVYLQKMFVPALGSEQTGK